MTDEKQTDCDGWVAYGPDGEWLYTVTIKKSESSCWAALVNLKLTHGDLEVARNVEKQLKKDGYSVRPVCFVSPSDKRYLDMRKKDHREALFEQMREETSD